MTACGAAAETGADYISCTIAGLGERAGNTDLKKFTAAYNYFCQQKLKIKKEPDIYYRLTEILAAFF
ncbi:MAG: hypothetical protein ACLFSO_08115 [Halanaerobium sp.]